MGEGSGSAFEVEQLRRAAFRGRFLRDLYATWCSHISVTHCDHIMGPMQARYRVYAPDPFLFGQVKSQSDINGRVNPTRFHTPPTGQETVLVLECPKDVVDGLRAEYGIHTGYTLDKHTGLDKGLITLFGSRAEPSQPLRTWIANLQWECVSETGLTLAVWHPRATFELVRQCWTGPVKLIKANTLTEAVRQLESPVKVERLADEVLVGQRHQDRPAGRDQLVEPAGGLQRVPRVLAEVMPGVDQYGVRPHPGGHGALGQTGHGADHVGHHVGVRDPVRAGARRQAARV
jgi:hypothetical protein